MSAVCLLVAGALRAVLPAERFTLAWEHSVQKTRWEEVYRVEADHLLLVESRVEGSGAGMEPAPGARLVDGLWRWQPSVAPLPELRLTLSPFTADYRICIEGRCTPLHALVHAQATDIAVVSVTPCAG